MDNLWSGNISISIVYIYICIILYDVSLYDIIWYYLPLYDTRLGPIAIRILHIYVNKKTYVIFKNCIHKIRGLSVTVMTCRNHFPTSNSEWTEEPKKQLGVCESNVRVTMWNLSKRGTTSRIVFQHSNGGKHRKATSIKQNYLFNFQGLPGLISQFPDFAGPPPFICRAL